MGASTKKNDGTSTRVESNTTITEIPHSTADFINTTMTTPGESLSLLKVKWK